MRTFTSKQHKLIADIFLLCDDLNISDRVKANIEYSKNNILEKEPCISALMNAINELLTIKFYINNSTEILFWQEFENRLIKKQFVKCKILIIPLKDITRLYRLKGIDTCSLVLSYFKTKVFFRRYNKIQRLIRNLNIFKTENATMFWYKIKGFLNNDEYFDKVSEILLHFYRLERFTNLMRYFAFYSNRDLIKLEHIKKISFVINQKNFFNGYIAEYEKVFQLTDYLSKQIENGKYNELNELYSVFDKFYLVKYDSVRIEIWKNIMSHFYNDYQLFKKYKDLAFLIFSVDACSQFYFFFALNDLFQREVFIWNQNAYFTFFKIIQQVSSFECKCQFLIAKFVAKNTQVDNNFFLLSKYEKELTITVKDVNLKKLFNWIQQQKFPTIKECEDFWVLCHQKSRDEAININNFRALPFFQLENTNVKSLKTLAFNSIDLKMIKNVFLNFSFCSFAKS